MTIRRAKPRALVERPQALAHAQMAVRRAWAGVRSWIRRPLGGRLARVGFLLRGPGVLLFVHRGTSSPMIGRPVRTPGESRIGWGATAPVRLRGCEVSC